jgi:electron transfer flavoprotein alpha/beta subunit
MDEDAIIDAVYQAVVDHIYSVVPQKRIVDLDVSVGIDGREISIDVTLITDRTQEIDQKTIEEAIKIGSEKADELMAKNS